jgi:uncharacterized UBP type Zn finger protein
MGLISKLSSVFRSKPTSCKHLALVHEVTPSSPDSCSQCIELGDTWVNLRVCLTCGQVGCCDNSKNTHATKHHHETDHPVIQSYQPGEGWRYCYVDEATLPDTDPFR